MEIGFPYAQSMLNAQVEMPSTGLGSPSSNDPVARNLLPDTTRIGWGGTLEIGKVNLLAVAREYGTPTFVYDEEHIENRCREAVSAFPDGVAYAGKAFLCGRLVRLLLSSGMKIDVATGGEMHLALNSGAEPSDLVFHGNNKSYEELRHAISIGVGTIIIDSFDEIDRIEDIRQSTNATPVSCLIRITPGITGDTHQHIMTGQDDSKFGFNLAAGLAKQAVERIRKSPHFILRGVHTHIGSQIFDVTAFESAAAILAEFVQEHDFEELCIGGGLGVPYINSDPRVSITEWGNVIHQAFERSGLGSKVKVTAEPGRAIIASAAVTLYSVGTIKEVPNIRTYLSIDGGMSDNPRPALYGAQYEAFLPRNPFGERTKEVAIAGKHCESGDVLIRSAFIPEQTEVGDVLALAVTGAYGYAMASNYNRVPRPPVLFVKNGKVAVAIRRETYDDFLRLEV